VTQLLTDFGGSSELFSELLGVLSSSPMTITFPLSRAEKERLINVISGFKHRMTDLQRQTDAVFTRAASLGFRGSRLSEAVDFIAAACVDTEKQKLSERMYHDMMDVRSRSEKEREVAEKQRHKAKQRISDLRGRIAVMQEHKATTEEELSERLEQEKQKLQQVTEELEHEKKIHQELMLAISGKAADSEYLRSRLNAKEMKKLTKAQEIRRFVEQMQEREAEEQRLRGLAQKNRQEAFKRGTTNLE